MFGSPEVGTTSDQPRQPCCVTADLPRPHEQDDPLPLGTTQADYADMPDLETVTDEPEVQPRFELLQET